MAKEPPRNPTGVSREGGTAFYANQGAYRTLIDAVCDEYSQAFSVDLAPGWDNTTMVSTLDTRNPELSPAPKARRDPIEVNLAVHVAVERRRSTVGSPRCWPPSCLG